VAGAEHVDRDSYEVEHDSRHVEHLVGPIAPAGEKAVEVAEFLLGPEIHTAFAWVPVRQFDHGNALRPEKQQD